MTKPHTQLENISNVNDLAMFLPAVERKVKESSNISNLLAEKTHSSLTPLVSKSALNLANTDHCQ